MKHAIKQLDETKDKEILMQLKPLLLEQLKPIEKDNAESIPLRTSEQLISNGLFKNTTNTTGDLAMPHEAGKKYGYIF